MGQGYAGEMVALISVCMATFNGSRYIERQLRSILGQLDQGDEVILVDDHSSDSTLDVVAKIDDGRIKVYRNGVNMGVLLTFGRAIQEANGDIIFLGDQDDVWYPEKVASIINVFDSRPDVTLVLSDAKVIDDAENVVADSFFEGRGSFSPGLLHNIFKNKFLGCTMAFRRSMVDKILPFPADIPMHDMWIGCINAIYGKSHFLDMPLMAYRRHRHNASPANRQGFGQILVWRWQLAKNLCLRVIMHR
jgi:glycosyltransferase involved in cell wall biosynthesis